MLEIGGKAGTTRMNTAKAPLQLVPTLPVVKRRRLWHTHQPSGFP